MQTLMYEIIFYSSNWAENTLHHLGQDMRTGSDIRVITVLLYVNTKELFQRSRPFWLYREPISHML